MKKEIELIRYVRKNILNVIEGLNLEQLNKVPDKFNNNIGWNLAHLVITQQIMAYKLGGLPLNEGIEWYAEFAPGTKPDRELSQSEIDAIKQALITSIDTFEQDCQSGKFSEYTAWDLHGVMDVTGVEDATKITCVHEGRHYGVITTLAKLVS
jgi:uncharacterized damage-inducible protein DinB